MTYNERVAFLTRLKKKQDDKIAKLKQELEAMWEHIKPSKREPYSGNFS